MWVKSSNFAGDFENRPREQALYDIGYTLLYFNFMALKIVVLAKQVPDTRNVGKDAMTAEGTVNRAALPAIFNPEDLNAL
jgi:electron transfer flavoprotein beta subunit